MNRAHLLTLAALLTGCAGPHTCPKRVIHVVDLESALNNQGPVHYRVFFDGGPCCPDHSIGPGFRKPFRKQVLDFLGAAFPGRELIETEEPPSGVYLIEVEFRLSESAEAVKPGAWPGLISVIASRETAGRPLRTEIGYWRTRVVFGSHEAIRAELKVLLDDFAEKLRESLDDPPDHPTER